MKKDNISKAKELLKIKDVIEDQQMKLEQLKGQRIGILKQLESLSLTPELAKIEHDELLKKIEKLEDELEDKQDAFIKKYPKLKE